MSTNDKPKTGGCKCGGKCGKTAKNCTCGAKKLPAVQKPATPTAPPASTDADKK
ncbi:MAG: hypothetical protein WCT03_07295 [Candidatus Obscuribacterales bacterium]|jgi:hypothetical protein